MSRTTADLRLAWPLNCRAVPLVVVEVAPGVRIQVHRDTAEAFRALACVFQAHGYHTRPGDTGAYNCRAITGGTRTSLHAHAIAADYNWNTNPYRSDGRLVTDMPPAMVADGKAIRTKGGAPVFRWGGDYGGAKDAMHWEVIATPAELAAGIDWRTVRMPARDPALPATWPTLHEGDTGPTVADLQRRLSVENGGVQRMGPKTIAAVIAYQRAHGLNDDGVVGLQTWTALLTDQPPLATGALSPVKLP
jgi:hypothetical protein